MIRHCATATSSLFLLQYLRIRLIGRPGACVYTLPPKKIVKRGCRKLAYSAMLEIMEEKKEWKKALILHT